MNLNLKLPIKFNRCKFVGIEGGSIHARGSLTTDLDVLLKVEMNDVTAEKGNN